jgi:DNA-binding MarR family transcriptional regulator
MKRAATRLNRCRRTCGRSSQFGWREKSFDAPRVYMYADCMNADDASLANKLGALWTTLTAAFAEAFDPLSDSTAAALLSLLYRAPITATALGRVIGLSQPATARVVDKLVADGLVARRKRSGGGKEVYMRLTPRGGKFVRSLQSLRLEACSGVLTILSVEDRATLNRLLDQLLAAPVTDRSYARHVCRFCDHSVCNGPDCPIGCAATELEANGELNKQVAPPG